MSISRRADWQILRCELRGEKRLFFLSALTTIVATATLSLVLALGDTFTHSFASSAKSLLGGDLAVRLSQRAFTPDETAWMRQNSARLSQVRVAGALAVVGEQTQLTRIKAVDAAYPLYGKLIIADESSADLSTPAPPHASAAILKTLSETPSTAVLPALISKDLAVLLNLQVGEHLEVAGLSLQVAGIILKEPDPDSRMWMSAALVLVGESATEALAGPGMLGRSFVRVKLHDDDSEEAWTGRLNEAFPDADWRVRRAENAMPGLQRFVGRMRDFLSLMSLAAMLIAGLGVGGAASAFLRARLRAIAVIKMLGGDAWLISRVYLGIIFIFILGGALLGAWAGGALLFWAAPILTPSLPITLAAEWPWSAMGRALLAAVLLGAAFIVPPTLRFARVNPLSLFNAADNESAAPTATRRDRIITAAIYILVILCIPLAWREKLAVAVILLAAAIIHSLTMICAVAAGRIATKIRPPLSWGLLTIARNSRQTAAAVVSFTVGMALLIATLNMEGNFAARIDDTLRREAPSFYMLGIREDQQQPLFDAITTIAPTAQTRAIPFLRGRIDAIGGRNADDIDAPEDLRWILRGDRGFTWTKNGGYIGASNVSAGALWDETESRPQASFDEEAAAGLGVSLGDELVLNILGRRLTTIVTSFREIDWQSFDINFVVILNDRPFGKVPYSLMGAIFLPPDREAAVKLEVARHYPNITPISTGAAFAVIKQLLEKMSFLLQTAALFILLSGVPLIIASLLDSQRRRTREAATMRLLGAARPVLVAKSATEFAAMAAVALLPALIFGLLAAKVVVENIFELEWQIGAGNPTVTALIGALLFFIAGLSSITHWLRYPPLELMRND